VAAPEQLTQAFRKANVILSARTVRDMLAIWPMFHGDVESFNGWVRAAGLVIERDRKVATGLAIAYLKAHRAASGITGTAPIVTADPIPPTQVVASLAATTFPHVRRAATVEQGLRTAFVTSSGAASRLAINGGRDTIVATIKADRHSVGWFRTTSGNPCAFCAMIASRGAVYKSEATAEFRPHDHCHCEPEPVYEGQSTLPKGPAAGWARLDQENATGHGKELLNSFRRAYESA